MSFSENIIQQVWNRGTPVEPNDPSVWRKDDCGAWMNRPHHGNRTSQYGWEIDHIVPLSNGGTDDITNLRPLQWENNAHRQNGYGGCAVISHGTQNGPIR
jgi:5-methylcytosine-specific restriction endonuclease McrA